MSDIIITGINELIDQLHIEFRSVFFTLSMAIGAEMQDRIAAYPAQTHKAQPFKSNRQRRGFFARLRRGDIEVPYRRGGKNSQTLGRRWMLMSAGGYVVLVNNATYAALVHSYQGQARYHKGNWQTDKRLADDIVNDGTAASMAEQAMIHAFKAE